MLSNTVLLFLSALISLFSAVVGRDAGSKISGALSDLMAQLERGVWECPWDEKANVALFSAVGMEKWLIQFLLLKKDID